MRTTRASARQRLPSAVPAALRPAPCATRCRSAPAPGSWPAQASPRPSPLTAGPRPPLRRRCGTPSNVQRLPGSPAAGSPALSPMRCGARGRGRRSKFPPIVLDLFSSVPLYTCERQYRIISEFYIYHTQFVRRLPAEEEREMLRFAQRGQRAARAVMRMGHATRQRQVCRRGLLARWCASRSDARRASRTAARARLTGPHAGRRMGAGGRQPGRKRRPNARPDAGALARRVGPARVCCAGAWRPRNRVADH